MKKPALLILAAGLGSRYGGLKQMDSVGPNGETIIDYSIYDAIQAGFGKVVCVIRSSFADEFKEKITSKFEDQIDVELVYQPIHATIHGLDYIPEREKPWGTGHAVLCAVNAIDEPFAMINADDFYGRKSLHILCDFLRNEASPSRYGMVGFILKNTLSPHGTVSRGVCTVSDEGTLETVREHTRISANEHGEISALWEGAEVALSSSGLVSMNMWGFHHSLFEYLEKRFHEFARAHASNPKAEFYIPLVVNELIDADTIALKVLSSDDKWYGVTYKEDKADVVQAIHDMIAKGIYPSSLT